MNLYKSIGLLLALVCLSLVGLAATNEVAEAVPLLVTGAPAFPYEIPVWFLIASLIFPRLTLLIAWASGSIPPNDIPFLGDFALAVFLPRILIMIYIYGCMGLCVWFWVHLAVCVITYLNAFRVRTKVGTIERSPL